MTKMTKVEIEAKIREMKKNLEETKDTISQTRGAVESAVAIVIPMMEDQLVVLEAILNLDCIQLYA